MDCVVWRIRYVFVDGAYGDNVNREQGFHVLSPTPPQQSSALWIGPGAISIKYCFPGNRASTPPAIDRPASYPGEQRLVFNQPQVGCTNGTSVPPLRRCWPKRGTIFDVAGYGVRLDSADQVVPTRVVFWMFNVTCVCEILVDADCLTRQPEPLVCYEETVRRHQNDSRSSLDDYVPEQQQQQQLHQAAAEEEKWQQQGQQQQSNQTQESSPQPPRGSPKASVVAAGA
ncbi:hypothetical protein PLESTF_000726100 [Pleodorina starrii]|nr:hypothetical protein PLESTF_000726100 [Pleodorina starrii]